MFELVFHADDDVLHLGVVGLAAGGVDFAPHLLGDEAELLALAVSVGEGLAEVVEVVGEALLLFVDVELLDVVDELLLEAVAVVVGAEGLLEVVEDAGTDVLDALFFVGLDGVEEGFDVIDFLAELLLESGALLAAELDEAVDGLARGGEGDVPLLVGEFGGGRACQHVGQAHEHGREGDGREGEAVGLLQLAELFVVGFQQLAVDGRGGSRGVFFNPQVELHLAALEHRGNQGAQLHLLLLIERGDARREVELLAVERLYFGTYLLVTEHADGLAVAGHRLNHSVTNY